MPSDPSSSSIRDNFRRGIVGDFLRAKVQEGSQLSFVSAYFTIYAYQALQRELSEIEHLNFLFGEPRFITSLDPDKTATKHFRIEDDELRLENKLEQKRLARDCADWIQSKSED